MLVTLSKFWMEIICVPQCSFYLPDSPWIRLNSYGREEWSQAQPTGEQNTQRCIRMSEWDSICKLAENQKILCKTRTMVYIHMYLQILAKVFRFLYHTLYYSILYIILYYIIHYKYYKYYIIYYATLSFMNYYQLSHYPQRNKMWSLWRRVHPHSHLSSNMICQIRKLNGIC